MQKGVKVRLGCPVVSVDDSAPSVTIKGGEVVSGDLILASDGELPPSGDLGHTLTACRS